MDRLPMPGGAVLSGATGSAAAVAAVVTLLVALPVGTAIAHPFGEPQVVQVTADQEQVTLVWRAPPDDLLLLGSAVGALPNRRELVLDVPPEGDPEPIEGTDAERLEGAPEIAEYLHERTAVRHDGEACAAEAAVDELTTTGARLVFTCPSHVQDGGVEIEIETLTDLHEGYRTVAVGGGRSSERRLYTAQETVHHWDLEVATAPDRLAGLTALAVAGAGCVGLAGVAWTLLGRRGPR